MNARDIERPLSIYEASIIELLVERLGVCGVLYGLADYCCKQAAHRLAAFADVPSAAPWHLKATMVAEVARRMRVSEREGRKS